MSKHNNHNRDSYEQAGRDRPSDQHLQEQNKQQFNKETSDLKEGSRNFIPGAAPVGQSDKKKGANE